MGPMSTDEEVGLQVMITYATFVLKGLAKDKCKATENTKGAAGPQTVPETTMAIEEELAENDLPAFTSDDNTENWRATRVQVDGFSN